MSPLSLEVYREGQNEWVEVGKINPGDGPGSISDNKLDGTRDVYIFECAEDDSKSTIFQSEFGVDAEKGETRVVISLKGLPVVRELKKGEFHEMEVRTDASKQPRKIRFRHK